MSRTTRIGSLKAAVKRLEAAAGKGERCASCRLHRRRSLPDPKRPRPRPEDVIHRKCEFCGLEYTVSLDEISEERRALYRLWYSFTAEDWYTNPKAHALLLWSLTRTERARARRRRAAARNQGDPRARARAELREEAVTLVMQRNRRLNAKYGAHPFPEQDQLIEAVRRSRYNVRNPDLFVKGLFDLELEETDLFVCAELEKIIWGETKPSTASAIEEMGRRIDELIRAAEEQAERRKEEKKRELEEFFNRNRD